MWTKFDKYILPFLAFAIWIFIFIPHVHILAEHKIESEIILEDRALEATLVFKNTSRGIGIPTGMEFLDNNDILVLDMNGHLQRIVNGVMIRPPLLDLEVAELDKRVLLGLAIYTNEYNKTRVFVYYPEASSDTALGNRLYKYELQNNTLVNPKLLLDLPMDNSDHAGGDTLVGPDNNIYLTVGDLDSSNTNKNFTSLNIANGTSADGRGGILRVTQDGEPVEGIIGDEYPLNLYYAYGIRNSFGMDFDPLSGKLWDTENGPRYGDEINAVEPGFNSGWSDVQGVWEPTGPTREARGKLNLQPHGLVDFEGRGNYSIPELIWIETVDPTALKFFNSNKWGSNYENDLFVADSRGGDGNIYRFDVNENRTKLLINDSTDFHDAIIIDNASNVKDNLFAHTNQMITDLEVGPDGNLYVLFAGIHNNGGIYKIAPKVE